MSGEEPFNVGEGMDMTKYFRQGIKWLADMVWDDPHAWPVIYDIVTHIVDGEGNVRPQIEVVRERAADGVTIGIERP